MGKILLIATNPHMRQLAVEYQHKNRLEDNLMIEEGAMDAAVRIANEYINQDIDVIICRGGSGRSIIRDNLPIPIVDMPIRDTEVMNSINEAIRISNQSKPRIAFLGYSSTYKQISAFIDALDIEIAHFDVEWEDGYEPLIEQIKTQYDVILGGNSAQQHADKHGIPAVIMDSSMTSVDMAYNLAVGTQKALLREKEWSSTLNAVVNTVQDGLISVNEDTEIFLCNEKARSIFALDPDQNYAGNVSLKDLLPGVDFSNFDSQKIREYGFHKIVEIYGNKFAIEALTITSEMNENMILFLFREVKHIQKIESKARAEIYSKGHRTEYSFQDILGRSEVIKRTIENAINFSHTDSHIYIYGETGTGKELFAQSIHNDSKRRNGPFVAINCGAIPESILKSELFGYEDGSFTGAKKGGKMGFFELAHGGTLFLDEISELDPDGQVSLLRVLQEQQVRRIGGESITPIDVRIITASNVPMTELLSRGKLREDLYYRLCVLTLNLPPLRNRSMDIPILASHFISHYNEKFQKNVLLDDSAYKILSNYSWPGNIRQLKNFCERIVAISREGILSGERIKQEIQEAFTCIYSDEQEECIPLEEPIVIKNRKIMPSEIKALLQLHNGNRTKVANDLGISRTTLWKVLNKSLT